MYVNNPRAPARTPSAAVATYVLIPTFIDAACRWSSVSWRAGRAPVGSPVVATVVTYYSA